MKVCMITFQYPPMFNGGVGSVASRLARNLAAAGVEVHVIAPGTHQLDERLVPTSEDGAIVHRTYPALGSYFGDHTQLGRIGDYVIALHREMDFDLVHALFLVPAGQLGAVVAGEIDRPLVASIHGSDVELMRYNPLLCGTLRWIVRRADVVTAVSSELLDKTQRFANINDGRVIPNALDPESFDPWSLREVTTSQGWRYQVFVESFLRSKRRGGPVVGTVGMIRPAKGFPFLLDAFHELVRTFSNAHLLIVGDIVNPQDKKEYLKRIKIMGLKRKVTLTGRVPPRQVMAWMREMDIFAMPSLHEGSPCALMEAMACGLAVVATKVGGIPDLLTDGVNGMLINCGDSRLLTEKLNILSSDTSSRTRLGTAAKYTIENHFSSKDETKSWLEVYRLLAATSPKPHVVS